MKRLESASKMDPLAHTSIVQLYRFYEGECHYCKAPNAKNISYGMNSDRMTVEDFQLLLDRGWARCGKWIYLPKNHKACCPMFAVRNLTQSLFSQ
jgi:arginyl-tRNA---protein transferase